MFIYRFLLAVVLVAAFTGCTDKPITAGDFSVEEAKILELHHAQRQYHFTKAVGAFVDQMSEQFISVNKGLVTRPSLAEQTNRFTQYFNSVEFEKWDDAQPPVVRFSDDGSMAYTVVQKEVIINFKNQAGEAVKEKTDFAWVTIYKKYDDTWKIDCVTSTSR